MDRYEKLKQYTSSIALEYQNKLEKIREDFENIDCNKNMEKWYKLAQQLQDCFAFFLYAKKKELRLKIEEQKIRAMLEDLHGNWIKEVYSRL